MASGRSATRRPAGQAGKSMVILLVIVAVASAAAGAGVVLFFPGTKHAPEQSQDRSQGRRPPHIKMASETLELAFNPPDKNRTRICKINVSFEVQAENVEEADRLIVERKEAAKSALLIHLSDVRVDQLLGSDNLNALRKELRKKCELLFFPKGEARLNDVFLGEVIVQ